MGRLALPPGQRPQRFLYKQGNLAYSSGTTSNLQMSQTDYLTAIDLVSLFTLVNSGAAPTSGQGTQVATEAAPNAISGAYAPLANIQVRVNGGRAPYSLPGFHANQFARVWNHDYIDLLEAHPNTISTTNNRKGPLRPPPAVGPIALQGSWYTGDTQLALFASLTFNPVANVFATV